MKVLAITNLFGYPWDPSRGVFNQQQFERLAQRVDLSVLVAVPWTEAIRRPAAYWSARHDGATPSCQTSRCARGDSPSDAA